MPATTSREPWRALVLRALRLRGLAVKCDGCPIPTDALYQAEYMNEDADPVNVNLCKRCWYNLQCNLEGRVTLWGVIYA